MNFPETAKRFFRPFTNRKNWKFFQFLTFVNDCSQGDVNYCKTKTGECRLYSQATKNAQKQCSMEAGFACFSTIC